MMVDPNGMEQDWVKNSETQEYVWMDNVTKPSETPKGYNYIGPTDQDVMNDLNLPQSYQKQEMSTGTAGVDGDPGVGAPVAGYTYARGRLSSRPIVSRSAANSSENNKEGRVFEGVLFSGQLTYSSANSANPEYSQNTYNGTLLISVGNETKSSQLQSVYCASCLYETGMSSISATNFIPAASFRNDGILRNATIRAGSPNPLLIFNPTIRFDWSLIGRDVLSPR